LESSQHSFLMLYCFLCTDCSYSWSNFLLSILFNFSDVILNWIDFLVSFAENSFQYIGIPLFFACWIFSFLFCNFTTFMYSFSQVFGGSLTNQLRKTISVPPFLLTYLLNISF
jgi:hypothetical protein